MQVYINLLVTKCMTAW